MGDSFPDVNVITANGAASSALPDEFEGSNLQPVRGYIVEDRGGSSRCPLLGGLL